MATKQDGFRVVIVGGSIAGLTLAHCLLKNNIDFIILESNREIAPQVGASIGILPNGARILDQLGVFDDILGATEPLAHGLTWSAAGKQISKSNAPRIIHQRYRAPMVFSGMQH
jgi:2-polyprenyl-6-methoxyphenol hydroxylase-like FAD-dependent oxidoreductase